MLTERKHAGEFLISELDGHGSRDNITVVSGQVLVAGAVLGKASGKYKNYDNQAVDGSQAAAGILYDNCDATAGDTPAVIINMDAEVNGNLLAWGTETGSDETAGIADLLALGIKIR